jgi:hypothetical protein
MFCVLEIQSLLKQAVLLSLPRPLAHDGPSSIAAGMEPLCQRVQGKGREEAVDRRVL